MEETAVLFQKEDNIGIIRFNRPHRLNAINQSLLREFIDQLHVAQQDPDVRSVILTGAGRAFCAGEDLKETSAGKSFTQWTVEVDGLQDLSLIHI